MLILFQLIGLVILALLVIPMAMLIVMGIVVPMVNIITWLMYDETLPINLFFDDSYDERFKRLKSKMSKKG